MTKRAVESITENGEAPPSKRRAVVSNEQILHSFRDGLLENQTRNEYQKLYSNSQPYKHGVIQDLLDTSLLRAVRTEIQDNISFTPKETDIYKIFQSGDLANLDGLDDDSLELLPSLVKIRDALYSAPFRDFLSKVTGAGALSGIKTDMAVNVYNATCHLLCHDDVIGSRRVSYILYLTDPDTPWDAKWGGALRLYPTETMREEDGTETKVPCPDPTTIIPPAFNQLSFFAVQPGESFHDVEEVYAATDEGDNTDDNKSFPNGKEKVILDTGRLISKQNLNASRVRMAISGWFHIPQPGEEGYEEGAQEKQAAKSSLAQLQGDADKYDMPQPDWRTVGIPEGSDTDEDQSFTEEELDEVVKFINPEYLTPEVVSQLNQQFSDDSLLEMADFLQPTCAKSVWSEFTGESSNDTPWIVARPPHKHKFLYRHNAGPFLDILFHSGAFRKWLRLVCGVRLGEQNVMTRHFRRGSDYTLATSYEDEIPQLELSLGLTPTNESGTTEEEEEDAGGYEVYMAGEDDTGSSHGVNIPSSSTGAGKRREKADPAVYQTAGDDEDDDILMTIPPSWNMLTLVFRDKGTLKFTKYLSRSAKRDRYDIVAEYKVVDLVDGSGEVDGGEFRSEGSSEADEGAEGDWVEDDEDET